MDANDIEATKLIKAALEQAEAILREARESDIVQKAHYTVAQAADRALEIMNDELFYINHQENQEKVKNG